MNLLSEFFDLGFSTILFKKEDALALGRGLLLGDDSGFSIELKRLAKSAGVTHLVAASGANLHFATSIGSLVTNKSRRVFVEVSRLVSVGLYLFLAGWSGSLWRATLHFILQFVGLFFGFRLPFWSTAVITVFFSLAWWGNIGFWLSFLAILGLRFSQKFLPGEKRSTLFPQKVRVQNYWWRELSTGVWVTGFVSLLLVPLFGWESIVWLSPLTTLLSSLVTPIYTWLMLILVSLEHLGNNVALLFPSLLLTFVKEFLERFIMVLWISLISLWRGASLFSTTFSAIVFLVGMSLFMLGPILQVTAKGRSKRMIRRWRKGMPL